MTENSEGAQPTRVVPIFESNDETRDESGNEHKSRDTSGNTSDDANNINSTASAQSTRQRYYPIPENLDLGKVKEWYERYKTVSGGDLLEEGKAHPILREIESDVLEEHAIQERIAEFSNQIRVTNGICDECQHLLDDWPLQFPDAEEYTEDDTEDYTEEDIEEDTEEDAEQDTKEVIEENIEEDIEEDIEEYSDDYAEEVYDDYAEEDSDDYTEEDSDSCTEEESDDYTEEDTASETGRNHRKLTKSLRACHTLIMEAAMRKGCKFCALIVQYLRRRGVWMSMRKTEIRIEFINEKETASISADHFTSKGQLIWVDFPGKNTYNSLGYKYNDWCEIEFIKEMADAGEKEAEEVDVLEQAKSWMRLCSENHENCSVPNNGPLPTRLISVAGDSPRLVLTAGWKTRPAYSTLSHCWGQKPFLRLVRDNLDAFLDMIPFSELPKTFRDSIAITKALELNYLWIDSLCIIQGDEDDWAREAAMMCDVYGGSAMNIAASSATNPHEGCFLKPEHYIDGFRKPVNVGGRSFLAQLELCDAYDQASAGSHLASRAWTLQEWLLPSRTIRFGDQGVVWECSELVASECLPLGLDRASPMNMFRPNYPECIRSRFPCDTRINIPKLRDTRWSSTITLYSAANLTYAVDKLPALSGLAKRVSLQHGWRYFAGIWQKSVMEAQLCWYSLGGGKRPREWRAPSWSWASVDSAVSYGFIYDGTIHYSKVLNIEVSFASNDPFGAVRSGTLTMCCSGMLVGYLSGTNAIKIELGNDMFVFTNDNDDSFRVNLDPLVNHDNDDDNMHSTASKDEGKSDCLYENDRNKEQKLSGDDNIYLLPICADFSGIILKSTKGLPGQFNRIGTFSCLYNRLEPTRLWARDFDEKLEATFKERGQATAEGVAADITENHEHPDMRYIITIV